MYIITIQRQKTYENLAETTAPDADSVIKEALRAYGIAIKSRQLLRAHNQYFRTGPGYPVGTHHLSIGTPQGNGLNVLETVIMRVHEAS